MVGLRLQVLFLALVDYFHLSKAGENIGQDGFFDVAGELSRYENGKQLLLNVNERRNFIKVFKNSGS
jgi:hypothetical protein